MEFEPKRWVQIASLKLIVGTAVLPIIILLVAPVASTLISRLGQATGSPCHSLAHVVMGCSAWLLAHQLFSLHNRALPGRSPILYQMLSLGVGLAVVIAFWLNQAQWPLGVSELLLMASSALTNVFVLAARPCPSHVGRVRRNCLFEVAVFIVGLWLAAVAALPHFDDQFMVAGFVTIALLTNLAYLADLREELAQKSTDEATP